MPLPPSLLNRSPPPPLRTSPLRSPQSTTPSLSLSKAMAAYDKHLKKAHKTIRHDFSSGCSSAPDTHWSSDAQELSLWDIPSEGDPGLLPSTASTLTPEEETSTKSRPPRVRDQSRAMGQRHSCSPRFPLHRNPSLLPVFQKGNPLEFPLRKMAGYTEDGEAIALARKD